MSYARSVSIGNEQSPFGDLVTVELTPVLQYAFEYDMVNNTTFWSKTETAGGTVTTANAMAVANTSSTANSVASITSVRPARYRSGFGSKLRFTARFTAPAASTKTAIGEFDSLGSTALFKNGYGIGYDGTTLKLLHFLNDTDISVNLADADDKLDGSGGSGMTILPTSLNIFEIDFAYLGTGDIIYRIYSPKAKDFVEFHRIQRANTETVPHSYNPNYKVWLYADNGATTNDVSIYTASIMYAIQGRVKYQEVHQPQFSTSASISGVTTQTQLFSIRNKTTYTSLTNFIDLLLESLSVVYESGTNGRGTIKIVLNPTLDGVASWSDISTTDSVVEVDTAQTTITTEGKVLSTVYTAGQFDAVNKVSLIPDEIFISPGDEVAVLVESTQSATFQAFLLWKELF